MIATGYERTINYAALNHYQNYIKKVLKYMHKSPILGDGRSSETAHFVYVIDQVSKLLWCFVS